VVHAYILSYWGGWGKKTSSDSECKKGPGNTVKAYLKNKQEKNDRQASHRKGKPNVQYPS
jgi:hypothetical protein